MDLLITLVKGTVVALITVLDICMLLRAILSWFVAEDNAFLGFVTMITEPLITPFRALFDHFGWFQNSPLDVPFFVAFIVLQILGTFVGGIF